MRLLLNYILQLQSVIYIAIYIAISLLFKIKNKMKTLITSSVILFSIIYFSACSKKKVDPIINNMNIMVAGIANNKATQWINGAPQTLSIGSNRPYVTDCIVANGDKYVIGYYDSVANNINFARSCYWKNGVEYKLNAKNIISWPVSIASNGSDVYILCNEISAANYGNNSLRDIVVYKNGIASTLTILNQGSAKTIKVMANKDVYVCADGFDGAKNTGVYFKNGNPTFIIPAAGKDLYVTDMDIINGIPYIIGNQYTNSNNPRPFLYSNGITTMLSSIESVADKIANYKGKPYVAGILIGGNSKLSIWYDGVEKTLPSLIGSNSNYGGVKDLHVSTDGNLYLLGYYFVGNNLVRNTIHINEELKMVVGDTTKNSYVDCFGIATF
jgi:hypothetical protein